jgi:hypothetical protein
MLQKLILNVFGCCYGDESLPFVPSSPCRDRDKDFVVCRQVSRKDRKRGSFAHVLDGPLPKIVRTNEAETCPNKATNYPCALYRQNMLCRAERNRFES